MLRVAQGKISKLKEMVEAIGAICPTAYMRLNKDGLSLETLSAGTDRYARLSVDSRWFDEYEYEPRIIKLTLTDTKLTTFLGSASPDDYLHLDVKFQAYPTSLLNLGLAKPNDKDGKEVRTETITVTRIYVTLSNTQLINNPVYTFCVDIMNPNDFLRFVEKAAEDSERCVHLRLGKSKYLVTITDGNNRKLLLYKDLGCRIYGIPDGICFNLEINVDSHRARYLNSVSKYLQFITIKTPDPRLNEQLPNLLETEIKFHDLAKIRFVFAVQHWEEGSLVVIQ